ncbi:MAG: hypothetical protein P4L50_28210 [Anaerolineaceae bacterium]|nr:hypothetical protein [Anaerolineaceae bacterium]
MSSLTIQGISAVKAGNIEEGNKLLRQALEQDSDDLLAWLWLSSAVDTDRERIICLENVLRIQPSHTLAKAALAKLSGETSQPAAESPVPPLPAAPERLNKIIKQSGELHLPPTPAYTPPPLPPLPPLPETPQNQEAEPAAAPAPKPKILSEDPYRKPRKKPLPLWLWLVMIILLGCIGAFLFFGYRSYTNIQKQISTQASSLQLTLTQVFAPTATATPTVTPSITSTATITPTPTLRPTSTLSPTPSLPPPNSADASIMKSIQQQVADLRGLQVTSQIPAYIIPKDQAVSLLINDLIPTETLAALQNEKQALVAFGLITPDFNLENHIINRLVDGSNGIYLPWNKQINIVSAQFGDIEQYTFSREFDLALVDQNFDLVKMGLTQACILEDERCQASQALAEGDSLLLQSQWLKQYAGLHLSRSVDAYKQPLQILVDPNPPAYDLEDLNFPYKYGQTFVTTLYNKGNWAQVNQAYQNPPQTTEQILHPEKYLSGEGPVAVNDTSIETALGSGWKLIESSSFGEWSTFLLLGYGSDVASQIDVKTAQAAAAGWGGDHYQVLYDAADDKTALAVHWVWDTLPDADEFQQAMATHLSKLYRGNALSRPKGQCWQVNDQATCLYAVGGQTLWLQGPDPQTLDALLVQFPAFN